MTPTEAGLLLQVRARQIVNLDNAVRHELESAGEGLAGMVRIGCVETNGAHALARWLRSWRCLHPRTRVEIYSADSDDLKSHLDAGAIDAALLLGPVEATKYQNVPLPARRRSPPACSKAFL
nr:LysR family transcriptional regulator substrate-binding protein [uncultured Sutterella sp.]